jgi:hypothetical protein
VKIVIIAKSIQPEERRMFSGLISFGVAAIGAVYEAVMVGFGAAATFWEGDHHNQ